MIKLSIPIDAIPQARPRVYSKRVAVDPPQSKQFKQQLAYMIKSLRKDSALLTGELKVELHIFRSAGVFKKGVTSARYGDVDNLAKGILDACNGVIWIDDKQISSLYVTKNLADTPRIDISIEEMN